jgi:phosphoglucosamine mutase
LSERIFGTDGIRGRAGEGWLTPARVALLGRALGELLPRTRARRALLGHDGRRSGPELECALAYGLSSTGFAVTSAGLITTPGLATLTRLEGFHLGAMLSASHNPAEDNGIKAFGPDGQKLSDELELAVEELLRALAAEPEAAPELGPPPPLDPELELRYLAYLLDNPGRGLKLDGVPIVLDCANGGASRIGPRVLGRLGARLSVLHAEPDGDNINQGCGATQPAGLQQEVRAQGARLGIALDGDGDRCVLVDERGELVHGDGILTVLGLHAMQNGVLADPRIVATVMSNRGLHRALREVGVSVVTVDVGDRRVVEALKRERLSLGGEQSGHVVFGEENHHVGDGLYTALRVLRVMMERGEPLSRLAAPYRPFPQVLVNVPVTRKPSLAELPEVVAEVRRFEEELGQDGRVLLRYSGTEPVARIMVEGPTLERIREMALDLAESLGRAIGA